MWIFHTCSFQKLQDQLTNVSVCWGEHGIHRAPKNCPSSFPFKDVSVFPGISFCMAVECFCNRMKLFGCLELSRASHVDRRGEGYGENSVLRCLMAL